MAGRVDVDVEDSALDDVEVVTCVTLGDYFDVFCWYGFLDEGAKDEVGAFFVEMTEEEVLGYGGAKTVELVVGFLVEGRFPVGILVCTWGQRFCGDGRSAGHVVVVWEALVIGARWLEGGWC